MTFLSSRTKYQTFRTRLSRLLRAFRIEIPTTMEPDDGVGAPIRSGRNRSLVNGALTKRRRVHRCPWDRKSRCEVQHATLWSVENALETGLILLDE